MLLRRVTEHVRKQNWFAVLLDFFIVVFGVFVGLQVDNWNEGQRSLQNEEKLLKRLYIDFEAIREDSEYHNNHMGKAKAELLDIIAGLSVDMDSTKAHAIAQRISNVSLAVPPGDSPTLTQLISNGEMSLIRKEALREALAEWVTLRQLYELSRDIIVGRLVIDSDAFYEVVWIVNVASNVDNPRLEQMMIDRVRSEELAIATLEIIDGIDRALSLVERQNAAASLVLNEIDAARN